MIVQQLALLGCGCNLWDVISMSEDLYNLRHSSLNMKRLVTGSHWTVVGAIGGKKEIQIAS